MRTRFDLGPTAIFLPRAAAQGSDFAPSSSGVSIYGGMPNLLVPAPNRTLVCASCPPHRVSPLHPNG